MNIAKILQDAKAVEGPVDNTLANENAAAQQAEMLERQSWLGVAYTNKFLHGLKIEHDRLTEVARTLSLDRTKREDLADILKETLTLEKVIAYARTNKYSND